ncbi:MAG: T9SS type A sorting domain-containing protein, partial [Candidatus Krumholzibacteriia bacterium]
AWIRGEVLGAPTAAPAGPPAAGSLTVSVHPNPFNPRLDVAFELAVSGTVELSVFDLRGRRVVHARTSLPAGHHTLSWDGREDCGRPAPSGSYLVKVVTERATATRKVTLAR